MEEIYAKLVDMIEKKLEVERSQITSNSNFMEDMGVDSLDLVDLIMSVEEEFDIEIEESEIDTLTTVDSLAEYIYKKKN